jgi:hypothetical protein
MANVQTAQVHALIVLPQPDVLIVKLAIILIIGV